MSSTGTARPSAAGTGSWPTGPASRPGRWARSSWTPVSGRCGSSARASICGPSVTSRPETPGRGSATVRRSAPSKPGGENHVRTSGLVPDLRNGRHLHRAVRLVPRPPQMPRLRLGAARAGPDARRPSLLPALAGAANSRAGAGGAGRLREAPRGGGGTRPRSTSRRCRSANGPPRAGSTRTPRT